MTTADKPVHPARRFVASLITGTLIGGAGAFAWGTSALAAEARAAQETYRATVQVATDAHRVEADFWQAAEQQAQQARAEQHRAALTEAREDAIDHIRGYERLAEDTAGKVMDSSAHDALVDGIEELAVEAATAHRGELDDIRAEADELAAAVEESHAEWQAEQERIRREREEQERRAREEAAAQERARQQSVATPAQSSPQASTTASSQQSQQASTTRPSAKQSSTPRFNIGHRTNVWTRGTQQHLDQCKGGVSWTESGRSRPWINEHRHCGADDLLWVPIGGHIEVTGLHAGIYEIVDEVTAYRGQKAAVADHLRGDVIFQTCHRDYDSSGRMRIVSAVKVG